MKKLTSKDKLAIGAACALIAGAGVLKVTDSQQARKFPVVVAAGDIAACGADTEQTAELVEKLNPDEVLTLGDNAYGAGSPAEYKECYAPTWGRFLDKTMPVPGNHDYGTVNVQGFRDYFGVGQSALADQPPLYRAYDVKGWRLYALDSMDTDPAQIEWLISDLDAHPRACVLAYWHHAHLTDGPHAPDEQPTVPKFWQVLAAEHADVVLVGHDHNYQRWPLTDGMREFVVGTGGASHYGVERKGALVVNGDTFGVLALTLRPRSYNWKFDPVEGGTFTDSGFGRCR